jgi:hypothetical protein
LEVIDFALLDEKVASPVNMEIIEVKPVNKWKKVK